MGDVELWKSFLVWEGRSMLYGFAMGYTIITSICVLRKLTGRLHYINVLFLPGFLSGLSLLVESKENQILNTLIFFNSLVEAIFNNLNYFDLFKVTRTRETVIFALVSSFLMYMLENRNKKLDFIYVWFYTPPKQLADDPDPQKPCSHPRKCIEYSIEGLWKYFSLGYLVNVIRRLIPKMGLLAKKPLSIFRLLLTKSNFKFGLFIGSYVGLYRILTCYLNRTKKIKKKFHGLIAGLLSGLTYAISPNMQVLSVGITTLLQLLYERISDKLKITNHFWQRQLLFMLCHGLLVHNKFYYPVTCPSYYANMIDACTDNATTEMLRSLITKYFQ